MNYSPDKKSDTLEIYFNRSIPSNKKTAIGIQLFDYFAAEDLNLALRHLQGLGNNYHVIPLGYEVALVEFSWKEMPIPQVRSLQELINFYTVLLTSPGATVHYYSSPQRIIPLTRQFIYC